MLGVKRNVTNINEWATHQFNKPMLVKELISILLFTISHIIMLI